MRRLFLTILYIMPTFYVFVSLPVCEGFPFLFFSFAKEVLVDSFTLHAQLPIQSMSVTNLCLVSSNYPVIKRGSSSIPHGDPCCEISALIPRPPAG